MYFPFSYYFLIKWFHFIKKTSPCGAVIFAIFRMENSENPSHYDLHIKMFNPTDQTF